MTNKPTISRRELLRAGLAFSTYAVLRSLWPSWLPRLAFAQAQVPGDVLVCVFLRGGADALNMIVPFGDDNYYAARPLLAFDPPDRRGGARALELTDFFGLNPDMKALHELFQNGHMTAIHAVGPPKVSRSHFEAMASMESGTDGREGAGSGWLGRHLMTTASPQDSPLRAIGWGDKLQASLQGYVSASSLRAIADFHLHGDLRQVDEMQSALAALYQEADPQLANTADATLQVLNTVRQIDVDKYQPANNARYDESDLGRGLKQTAALIKAQVGLEAACIDHGNFDTHVAQGRTGGLFTGLVSTLANNLRAFHDDMLDYLGRVTVVVMSEFGRRVQENGGGGTDHGHGGAMYVMSGQLTSGPVLATWPGLNSDFLDNGDLQITLDYRDVLSEILQKRAPNTDLSFVFPEHQYREVGFLSRI
jgi:uncharacterized protein (DUF1501 family)